MMTKESAEFCAEQLMRNIAFVQDNSKDLVFRIIKTAVSSEYAKRNPGFRFRRTARTRAFYWCCHAGPNIPIYDFMNGTVQLTTDENCYVLSGTRNERYVTSLTKLTKMFTFSSSEYITPMKLRTYADGQWFRVYPVQSDTDDIALTTAPVWAISIPAELEFTVRVNPFDTRKGNSSGIDHAAGDLILIGDSGGAPDFMRFALVNGGVFADCYSKRNFVEYLSYMKPRKVKEPEALLLNRA